METLIARLSLMDKDWQRIIYDATGVILLESLDLVSNCGCISLDEDSVYSYASGADVTEYCEVNSIDEAIAYIKAMDSYSDLFQDVSYGKFSKAELYWGILERILLRPENFSDEGQAWGLYNIGTHGEQVQLHMALIACDAVDIGLDISEGTTLKAALQMVVTELNVSADVQDWIPYQKVFAGVYSVPRTYAELQDRCSTGVVFGCGCE